MENDRSKRKRLITFRDFKVGGIVAIVVVCFCTYFKALGERNWEKKWKRLMIESCKIVQECREIDSREGFLFETCSLASLIATVESCASNRVNNVYYVGTEDGFDYFIHNSDFTKRRIRLPSDNSNANNKMMRKQNPLQWIQITKDPSSAAIDLTNFLNGGQLKK